jgi:hypothetical protein
MKMTVFRIVEWLIAVMTEAASTCETSVNFYQTTRRNNPEDSHLHILASLQIFHKSETKLILFK